MAGVCGPAYGTIMRYTDIEYDATKLKMGLDSDQTDAGLIFGLGLAINYSFQLRDAHPSLDRRRAGTAGSSPTGS